MGLASLGVKNSSKACERVSAATQNCLLWRTNNYRPVTVWIDTTSFFLLGYNATGGEIYVELDETRRMRIKKKRKGGRK